MRRADRLGSFKIQLAKFTVEFLLAEGKKRTPRCLCPNFDVSDYIVEHYDTDGRFYTGSRVYHWQKIICGAWGSTVVKALCY